ncbi:MAG: hypothetical protein ABI615_05395 [Chthoniobacterales bacterium]
MRSVPAIVLLGILTVCARASAQEIKTVTYLEAQSLLYFDGEVRMKGRVVQISPDDSGMTTFINFGDKYPAQYFSASIAKQYLGRFESLDKFIGKEVEITGKLRTRIGKPNIPITTPEQIKLVEAPAS